MFYYIENEAFICKSETEIKTSEDTKVIKLNENLENPFFENGEIIEYSESKEFEKQALENQKTQILKELAKLNGYIEGAKKLKEMLIFDEDDELELVGYEAKAQELIIKRSEIKIQIKML